ncbi:hypothetical protein HHK36_024259 [Tetracentron sinense]|uniref:Uncharacterized protein n=1 Tax=Tetracentron sinense TaxID=13715 RepID=A0A834YKP1_TETSI|nr:hypothetical protein HHK36_024259 [Tetracentron sinense]
MGRLGSSIYLGNSVSLLKHGSQRSNFSRPPFVRFVRRERERERERERYERIEEKENIFSSLSHTFVTLLDSQISYLRSVFDNLRSYYTFLLPRFSPLLLEFQVPLLNIYSNSIIFLFRVSYPSIAQLKSTIFTHSKMFGFMKTPINKVFRLNSVDPGFTGSSSSNPFDSNTESDAKQTFKPSRRTSSEPALIIPNFNPFDEDEGIGGSSSSSSSSYLVTSAARKDYKNDFHHSGGLENQSVQNYAVYKAEETTKTVNSCLKMAEDIREDATKTLVTLHQQGEQITRTHMVAASIDLDLSRVCLFSQS